jgi:serine/threonine protein kinase
MFSLGLILAELLLSRRDNSSPQMIRFQQPTFPTSPPQSHSPQPLLDTPLLSTTSSSRRSLIERIITLFGPLPQLYRAGKFWSDGISTQANHDTLLSQRMEDENVDPELIDLIMSMVHLDPEKRISAREALRHEWLVGPLLGYWAVLGVEWQPQEPREQACQRNPLLDNLAREISIDSRSSTPEGLMSPEKVLDKSHAETVKRLPLLYDFTKMEEDLEDLEDEVSQIIYESPTRPLSLDLSTKRTLVDLSVLDDPDVQVLFPAFP